MNDFEYYYKKFRIEITCENYIYSSLGKEYLIFHPIQDNMCEILFYMLKNVLCNASKLNVAISKNN